MAYGIFIFVIILNFLTNCSNARQSLNVMEARDSTGKIFSDGLGVVSPGQSIFIECTHKGNISWSRQSLSKSEVENLKRNKYIDMTGNILTIKNITFSDVAVYYCAKNGVAYRFLLHVYAIINSQDGTVPMSEIPFDMNGIKFLQLKINEKMNANVSCSCDSGSETENVVITWKGGLYTNKISDSYFTTINQNGTVQTNTLIVNKLSQLLLSGNCIYLFILSGNDEDLYGEYICSCNVYTGPGKEKKVYLKVPPVFENHESSMKANEGENVTITCKVWAYPPITYPVQWRFQNSSILRGGIITTSNQSHPGSSQIHIPYVTQADRGVYTCHATNGFSSNVAGTMVRVKGRFAALWPFIGILVQIVILAVIIIVYEWKKSHKDQESELKVNCDSKVEHEPAVSTKGGSESTDLRQRLMVN